MANVKALTKQEGPKRLLGCSNVCSFLIAPFYALVENKNSADQKNSGQRQELKNHTSQQTF